ncbi:MAG: hypothetical protein RIR01_282 [Bacteroidota bacterium]|jgi:hypothetical protein
MAVKTKAQILAEISSLLADNTTGDISALDVRTVVNDITDSYENLITAGTTSQYWRGDKTWQTFPVTELTGSLTAAQINALDTTPITLLAAAGANKYYVIENTSFHYKAGTTGFTTTGNLRLKYVTANRNIFTTLNTSTLTGTTDRVYIGVPAALDLENTIINDSISVDCSAAISGGDGTINYSIKYRIVTTS